MCPTSGRSLAICTFASLALALTSGCGGGRREFSLKDIGFSMEMPAGWRQGEPRMAGGFYSTTTGTCFYEDKEKDLPYGNVTAFPREGSSLKEHVDKVIEQDKAFTGMQQSLVGALGGMVGGEVEKEAEKARQALETEITAPTELSLDGRTAYAVTFKTPDFVVHRVFVEKGSEVIEVIFKVDAGDFPRYEAAFKAAAATIRVQ